MIKARIRAISLSVERKGQTLYWLYIGKWHFDMLKGQWLLEHKLTLWFPVLENGPYLDLWVPWNCNHHFIKLRFEFLSVAALFNLSFHFVIFYNVQHLAVYWSLWTTTLVRKCFILFIYLFLLISRFLLRVQYSKLCNIGRNRQM